MSSAPTSTAATPTASHHSRHISRGGIAAYEALKAAWVAANPDTSPADYEAAMVRFARLAGV